MSDRHDEEIVRLVTAGGPQEAHLWRQALEGEEIRRRVGGRNTSLMNPACFC
jgi:hypothetical protein